MRLVPCAGRAAISFLLKEKCNPSMVVTSARLPSRSLLFFRSVGRLRAPKRGAHIKSVIEPERPRRAIKSTFSLVLSFFATEKRKNI